MYNDVMTNKIIFLRHADTEKDSSIKSIKWGLSQIGKQQAKNILNDDVFSNVDIIISSEEEKSYLTALPLAEKLGIKIERSSYFNEVIRGDKFLSDEEFKLEKEKQLTDWNYEAYGGESGDQAAARFKKGIGIVSNEHHGKMILIVTHGTILNMYFAEILNVHNTLFERWQKTKFCAYGVVANGEVIKDII